MFNQDTLATAVAEEMIKVYRNELGPEPVPLTVPAGEAISEEDVSFIVFIYVIYSYCNYEFVSIFMKLLICEFIRLESLFLLIL